MTLETRLDGLHARVRQWPVLGHFTVLTRLLLLLGSIYLLCWDYSQLKLLF